MPRRGENPDLPKTRDLSPSAPPPDAPPVAFFWHTKAARDRILAHLAHAGLVAQPSDSLAPDAAHFALDQLILVHDDNSPQSWEPLQSLAERGHACVLISEAPCEALLARALRAGFLDVLPLRLPRAEFLTRLAETQARQISRTRREAAALHRASRLSALCKGLLKSRRELVANFTTLCGDMAATTSDLSSQLDLAALASEFNSLIRQELDIEGLLRTVLEFALPRIGNTNAAIFLPATSGEFSLGAYVNFDCPRDSAEVLLEHMSNCVAPAFEHEQNIAVLPTHADLVQKLGNHAHWIEDSTLLAFSCRHDNECLAIVTLFRDRKTPFAAGQFPMLRVIRDLFARQLARVIHTHHRHLPREKWGHFGEPEGGSDMDLAA